MESAIALTKKRIFGRVEFNNGWFAEIQTFGVDGIEKDILLDAIQVHREEMTLSKEQFQQEFRVGQVLDITTTTELRHLEANCL